MAKVARGVPAWGLRATGYVELVGINETVAQNNLAASVALPPMGESGYIVGVNFKQIESGTGDLLDVDGVLYLLNADPAVAVNDAALTAGEWATVIGKVALAAANWDAGDANGAIATLTPNIPYYVSGGTPLYAVFRLTSATSINSAAGDDELLSINVLYERWS